MYSAYDLRVVTCMDVEEAIRKRRAYRALTPVEITDAMIRNLATNAQLAASCFNKQPWHFVFVRDNDMLARLQAFMSKNNRWVQGASMIIAVYSSKDQDCLLPNREYFLFDTGMATGQLILRATEMGLVAHPIAGFDDEKVKELLEIPSDSTLITLVIVGKHAPKNTDLLTEKQVDIEKLRPIRDELEKFIRII